MFFSKGQDPRICDLTSQDMQPLSPDMISLTGKTHIDPATITGDVVNIVFLGQSTNNNTIVGDTFVPTNGSALYNMSIQHRGEVWLARNPLLAGDALDGHHGLRLADSIVTNGLAAKVIITMAAHGGSYAAHWSPTSVPVGGTRESLMSNGGVLAHRIGLAKRCLSRFNLDRFPTIIDWQQGEWDSDTPSTSQANHTAALTNIINECKRVGLLRSDGVMFIHKCTRITGASTTADRNRIRAAQAAVCDGVLVREGADIDSLGFEYRDDYQTHFTPSGAAAQAALKLPFYNTFLA